MGVPTLRFKDKNGQSFPAWTESDFKAVSKINQGLQIPISERFTETGDNRHFYITNEFLRADSKSTYFIYNPPKSVLCNEDDILMTRTGNTGKVVTGVQGAFHNNFFKIDYDRKSLNKKFVCEFLTLSKTQSLILKLAGTSTIPDLNHSDFYKININFPTLPEQTKIANFLTAVDEKITHLTQKADLLAQYKKGVMQLIFSQKLRFKDDDGDDFPAWEEKEVGNVFKVTRGNVLSMTLVNALPSEVSPYPVYSSQTNINGLSGYFSNYLYENSITWTTDGANAGEVNYRIGKFYCTNVCGVLISSEGYANACVAAMINAVSKKYVSYVGNPKLMNGVMAKIKISFPCVTEQTKIANFLTAIDDKITQTKTQLAAVKQYKQGLLQQMFV